MLLKLNTNVELRNIELNTVVKRYSRLECYKTSYVSGKCSSNKMCVALVKLPEQSTSRAVHLLYFAQVSASVNNDIKFYVLAHVLWLKEHHNGYVRGKAWSCGERIYLRLVYPCSFHLKG